MALITPEVSPMENRFIVGVLTLIFTLIFIFSIEALAQTEKTALDPCRADLNRYCQDVEPGGGNFLKCLEDHKDKLTSDCRTRSQKVHHLMMELRRACNNDLLQFCDMLKPGEGRILRCLKDNSRQLSNSCTIGIRNAMEARKDLLENQWP